MMAAAMHFVGTLSQNQIFFFVGGRGEYTYAKSGAKLQG